MFDFSAVPGVTVLREADLPDALRDLIASQGTDAIQALAAHDLPPGVEKWLGGGPGVTIIVADTLHTPLQRMPPVVDLIRKIERITADLHGLQQAGDQTAAEGAVSALRAALLELASTPAGRNSDVRGKARCVRSHMAAGNLSSVGRAMIEAALAADARAWGIGRTGH